MDTRLIDVTTGSREAVSDLTGACQDFLREVGAATGCCTCGCRTRPPAWPSSRRERAATTTCSPRCASCCRWTALAPPARLARARSRPRAAGAVPAVRLGPGARRGDGAGHLAVGLPGRPQRRQPAAAGTAVLPAGLTGMQAGPTGLPGGRAIRAGVGRVPPKKCAFGLRDGPVDVWTTRERLDRSTPAGHAGHWEARA